MRLHDFTYLQLVEDVERQLQFPGFDAGVHEGRVGVHIAGNGPAAHLCHQLQGPPQGLALPTERNDCRDELTARLQGSTSVSPHNS